MRVRTVLQENKEKLSKTSARLQLLFRIHRAESHCLDVWLLKLQRARGINICVPTTDPRVPIFNVTQPYKCDAVFVNAANNQIRKERNTWLTKYINLEKLL